MSVQGAVGDSAGKQQRSVDEAIYLTPTELTEVTSDVWLKPGSVYPFTDLKLVTVTLTNTPLQLLHLQRSKTSGRRWYACTTQIDHIPCGNRS